MSGCYTGTLCFADRTCYPRPKVNNVKKFIFELPTLQHTSNTIHRHLFPDTPLSSADVRRVIIEETSLLLSLYLGIYEDHDVLDISQYIDECDYFQECLELLEELTSDPVWAKHQHLRLHRLEVLTPNGLVMVHFSPLTRGSV